MAPLRSFRARTATVRERRDNQAYYDEFAAGYEKRRHHGYHALNEFFLTEALFNLQPLFPFTDA